MGTTTRYLDQAVDSEVAYNVIEGLDEAGYSPEEAIPGLVMAITLLAEKTRFPEECLDEAANLLADGPAPGEILEY